MPTLLSKTLIVDQHIKTTILLLCYLLLLCLPGSSAQIKEIYETGIMTELTYKEVSYIRSALQYRLKGLEREIEADNSGKLDPPLTDDERIDIQEDIIYYDKLVYMFEKAEKQSEELKVVESIIIPE